MRIAVSGATGFIGQHVVAALEKCGITPILLVRPTSSLLLTQTNHKTIPLDIEYLPRENLYQKIGEPDAFIHCAWAGLPNYKSHHHFEKELFIQYQFISKLIKDGLKNIVITGTCAEYGMITGILHEEMITKPSHSYGFAKYSLLQQLNYFQQSHSFNLTWARLFYLYGEGQSQQSLLMQLKQAIFNNESVFNMSGGEQLRDYLHVAKAATYLVLLSSLQQNNGVVNICSGFPISVRKLVETWIVENNWDINLNLGYYPYPDYEPMAFWGDRKKLDACLKACAKELA